MVLVVVEQEHSLMSCWTLLIQSHYGMSMGLMMTFWYVLYITNYQLIVI